MATRKTYGNVVFGTAFVLAILMLVGVIAWKHDWSNIFLGASVFILYGMGQWLSVLYWHNIQKDWEDTGIVLGRLQQAVTDIPAALDSNLKSIATRLTEGQAQALEKLQSQVHDGARETLEKGAAQIGDSLAKNLQAPLTAMKSMLDAQSEKSAAHVAQLQAITSAAREDSQRSLEKGSDMIAQSLDKNLRAPLLSLETTLASWQRQADAQAEAARAFGEELRQAQREWSAKSQQLADGLSVELKELAAAGARSGEQSQAAWAERAAQVQSAWENQIQALQSRIVETLGREGARLGQTFSASADALLVRVEALQGSQTETQGEILDRALNGLESQGKSMQEAAEAYEDGLTRLREASLELVRNVEAKTSAAHDKLAETLSAGHARLVGEISGLQQRALGDAGKTLEAQGQLGLEVAGKVSDLADQMRQGSKDLQELAHVSQINQTEMQASVAMLNEGLSSILDRLEKQAAAGDGYQALLAELGRVLASFQERSAEVLVENAMKTQEILMEVLHQQQRANVPAEGEVAAVN